MQHQKMYHSKTIKKDGKEVLVEGPIDSKTLKNYYFDEGLVAFRTPEKQYEAILSIADFEEGRIIIARDGNKIVGYATYLHPDALERWSTYKMDNLIELGAVEVSHEYRGMRVGSTLLEVSMMDPQMEHYIIITTEYYWHWDLKNTGLNVWQYRKVMEKMMANGGLEPVATDDPEIMAHPANCLLVRIGKHVDEVSIKKFDAMRFMSRRDFLM